jgi:hypothetical protein
VTQYLANFVFFLLYNQSFSFQVCFSFKYSEQGIKWLVDFKMLFLRLYTTCEKRVEHDCIKWNGVNGKLIKHGWLLMILTLYVHPSRTPWDVQSEVLLPTYFASNALKFRLLCLGKIFSLPQTDLASFHLVREQDDISIMLLHFIFKYFINTLQYCIVWCSLACKCSLSSLPVL